MRIGTCVGFKSIETLEEQLLMLKKYNFSSCQLLGWNPELWTDENAAIVREMFEKHEVTISAFWCGWEGPKVWDFYDGQLTLGLVPQDFRVMRMKNLCDGADWAAKLGVTDVVTHMGFIPENPYDPNFMPFCVAVRTVAQHLQKNGQYLLFETGQETPVALVRCFEVVGTDNLGVNLDTANLILYGKANPVDALDVFGQYVRNVHAKDGFYPTNGHSLGREVRIGQGKVDFRAFFSRLKEFGYDGEITIEYEVADNDNLKVILESREYLQRVWDTV